MVSRKSLKDSFAFAVWLLVNYDASLVGWILLLSPRLQNLTL